MAFVIVLLRTSESESGDLYIKKESIPRGCCRQNHSTIFGNTRCGLQKATGLRTSHAHHAFLYISLPSLHDYDMKVSFNFLEGENTLHRLYFSFPELRYSL